MECPICFEVPEASQIMSYATMSNHSWQNSTRCNAHGICRSCMGRYVEIQILEEGHFNPRCPGERCSYRLVPLDVPRALERSARGEETWQKFEQLRSECHAGRLKELLSEQGPALATAWLLSECQPCPRCLTLVRREEGCLHVFCRCGCDFCFGCGGPDPEGCICPYMEKTREVVFAAWLRTSPESPVEWLWESRARVEEDQERFLSSLHFFLWMAGAEVEAPWSESPGDTFTTTSEQLQGLDPIRWLPQGGVDSDVFSGPLGPLDDYFTDIEGQEEDDDWAVHYHTVPQKPVRRHLSERQWRRGERFRQQRMRWAGTSTVAVPLQPQRQPRALNALSRTARRLARQSGVLERSTPSERHMGRGERRSFEQ